jgi:hypothetical protein
MLRISVNATYRQYAPRIIGSLMRKMWKKTVAGIIRWNNLSQATPVGPEREITQAQMKLIG